MTPIPLLEFARIVQGTLSGPAHAMVSGFATDHREARPGDVFLAIKGARVDGHDFAAEAMTRGAVAVLAERPLETPHVLVGNLVDALARLGSHYRASFEGPVIGITGSAGKTTAKEFAAAALKPLGPVLKTIGNRNTEYTAPLLWADRDQEHRSAVVEMSMRGFGQIAHLAAIARPTIGLITNIGYSHLETVGSREGIAKAKGELIQALPEWAPLILWEGDAFFKMLRDMSAGPVKTFGFNEMSDCWIQEYSPIDWSKSRIAGYVEGQPFEAELPVIGRHLALNAAAGLLAAVLAGSPASEAARSLSEAEIPPMRMQVVERNGVKVLLDSYNASPPSMVAAIETFAALPAERRYAIIGEMKELGEYAEEAHREVGRALARAGLDGILYTGDMTLFCQEECAGEVATSIDDAREFLQRADPGDAVLIKGSRALELERVLE